MKTKKKQVKRKGQFGLQNIPQLNPNAVSVGGEYNWITGDSNMPVNPAAVDPISQMPIIAQGQSTPQAKTIPFRRNPDGSMVVSREEGTGVYKNNPAVEGFNYLATGVTGIANRITENRLRNREQQQVMESLQQPYWENMEGEGLNNIPAYTKAGGYAGKYIVKRPTGGGPLTSEGAKEILRDGKVNGKKLTPKQKRYFGAVAGGDNKKQTGGASTATSSNPGMNRRLSPTEMEQWNSFLDYVKDQGYEGSSDLNTKNKNLGATLFSDFKKTNPNLTIDYDIVPAVQNEMQILGQSARDFAARRNDPNAKNLMTGVSPVDGWFGSKTSQFRFPSAVLVNQRNNQTVGTQNLGLVSGNLQATGVGAAGKPRIPKGVKVETFYDAQGNATGQGYEDPTTGNLVELQYGGHGRKYMLQAGGDVPPGYHVMPDGSLMSDNEMQPENGMPVMQGGPVEAEAGEIVEGGNGKIFKVSDNSNTHEQGGVKMDNVKRVLEDTSDQRKDRASKMLRISPEEMEALFGFKPNNSVSHSKAYELAKKHYDGQRNKVNNKNETIAKKPKIDKLAAKSAELNFKTLQDIPTDEDVYDALFMHQQEVKRINDINDDGSMKKMHGGKYNVRGRRLSHHKAQAGTESDGFSRPGRGRGNDYYFDEGTQRWFRNGTVPSQSAKQQVQQNQSATQQTVQPQINPGGVQPYQGGRTSAGRTTPMGNSNAFGFTGGLDAYKSAWSPVIDLSQYNTAQDAQQATYNYILQNAPQEAAKIWQTQGLTQKGRDMMNPKSKSYDPAFAQVASKAFDASGRIKPGTELTNEQLQALTPAYSDNMLGIRSLTPSQMETSTTEPVTTPLPTTRQPLNTGVNINPNFIRQPSNRFNEPTYWDEVAAPLAGLVEGRDPELYNPVELNQLKYKLLDPTAALNANQADYNAAASTLENIDTGTGAEAANLANLQAQKYNANAQVMSQYDNQNVGIKNREIEYNTGVRDRQSVADAQTRGTYHRNVQQARENQRQQRLKSIEDISRVIQMKRRQNRSGNLILKLSPAFNQEGDYNGYQYAPILPADLGINSEMPVVTSKGKTTTTKTTKIGNTTIRSTNSSR